LSKINELSEGKNVVQLSTSARQVPSTSQTEIITMSPFQTKRTQQVAQLQKQFDEMAKVANDLVGQLKAIDESDIQVPVIASTPSKGRKQQHSTTPLAGDPVFLAENCSSPLTPTLLLEDPLREQETSHKSAKSAGSKQSQRWRRVPVIAEVSPVAHGSKDTVAGSSRRDSLRSAHKIQLTPLTIDFANVNLEDGDAEESAEVEYDSYQQVERSTSQQVSNIH
jgi:hypothetical protein